MTGLRRPKILIVAYPGQGLVNPSLRFATHLINLGAAVTFSTSLSATRRLDKDTTPAGITIAPFSDGHDNGIQPTTSIQQYVSDFAIIGACAVAETITSAAATGHPYDHVVYTTITPWAAHVARAHNVKSTLLWCQPATILGIYYHYFNGYQKCISQSKHNPKFQLDLPGLPPLTIADLPSFFSPTSPKDHEFILSLYKDHIETLESAPRVLVNTFTELELQPINGIKKVHFLTIGPLIPEQQPVDVKETTYMQWLNTKPKGSVVYVSFGSFSTLSIDQAEEMATALVESKMPFLWVIRDSGETKKLSKIDELNEQGMIVEWCSQTEVLRNEAVGCFVTHCGWNSTVETLVAGVPVVAFPQWTDQKTNAKLIEDVWKIGVRVSVREEDGVVEGKEIKRCLEMVMGDCGMKENAEEWGNLAKEAVKDGGSSMINLQAFLDDV